MDLKPQELKAIERQIADLKEMNARLNEQIKRNANKRKSTNHPAKVKSKLKQP